MKAKVFLYCITAAALFFSISMQAQNVGIGTTSPQGEFHVSTPNQITGPIFIGSGLDDIVVDFDPEAAISSGAQYTIVVDNAGPNPNLIDIYFNDNLLYNDVPMANSGIVLGTGITIGFESLFGHTYNDSWLITIAPGTLDQFIVAGKNVGIGTGSPVYDLDLVGDLNLTGNIYKNGVPDAHIESIDALNDGINDDSNLSLGSSAGSQNTGSKNLFLGNNAGKLNVSGDENVFLGYAAGEANSSGSGNVFIGNEILSSSGESNRLKINNDNSARPLIYGEFDSEFVGINRNSKIVNQEAFGISKDVSGSGAYAGMYVEARGSLTSRPFYGFAINNSGYAWIEYDGDSRNVIVNNNNSISNSGGNFRVRYNTAIKPNGGSWADNSDARLKKNIRTMDSYDMLQKLRGMRGVHYEWDDKVTDFKRAEGEQIGFIAQDLQKIWPEKVTRDHQGYLMTAYGDYDPVFVEAIKELADQVEKQAVTIDILNQKVAKLERLNKSGAVSTKNQSTN